MTHERGRMRALLRPITVPVIAGMRHPTRSDEAALAALMMRAYVGTIDYEGEDESDALVEVRHTLSGGKGTFLWTASHVIERDGVLASATLVIRWKVFECTLVCMRPSTSIFSQTRGTPISLARQKHKGKIKRPFKNPS